MKGSQYFIIILEINQNMQFMVVLIYLFKVTKGFSSLASFGSKNNFIVKKKPMEGAEKDGALGFFKGLGKGVVG